MNDAPDPKPRGGRRVNGKFAPGVSGNPGGRSATLVEVMRLARNQSPASIAKLVAIRDDPKTHPRDAIAAANSILDRGCGKAITPVYQGEHGMPVELLGESGPDGETTALLRSARCNEKDKRRKELLAELGRLDREERTEREIYDSQMTVACEAERNGEPLSNAMRLLVAVKNERE